MISTAGNALFYVYFLFSIYILENGSHKAVLGLKMTITRPFQQALIEWCEINSFAVIIRVSAMLRKNGARQNYFWEKRSKPSFASEISTEVHISEIHG